MAKKNRNLALGIFVVAVVLVAAACGGTSSEPPPAPPPSPTRAAVAISPSPTAPAPAGPTVTPEPVPSATTAPAPATPTPRPPSPTPTAEPRFSYTVVDSNGDQVVFDKPPERIVAFGSAAVETLFVIGEGHRVVGTHDFVSYPPETADIARVGGAFNMNIEATVALEPDLVYVFSETFLADLERVGLKVLYIKSLSDDFRGVADSIRMWGGITDSVEEAEKAAAEFETRVATIEETMAAQGDGPTVFQDEGNLWTPGPDTLLGEVFRLLKLRNIAHDVSGYAQLSPEIIVARDPEIVISSYGDQISDNPAFSNLTAVREQRVYVPSSDALSIAGPRYIDGIEELAKWVYHDLFE